MADDCCNNEHTVWRTMNKQYTRHGDTFLFRRFSFIIVFLVIFFLFLYDLCTKAQTTSLEFKSYHFIVARLLHFYSRRETDEWSLIRSLPPQQVTTIEDVWLKVCVPLSKSQITLSNGAVASMPGLYALMARRSCYCDEFIWRQSHSMCVEGNPLQERLQSAPTPFESSSRHLARGARTGDNSSSRSWILYSAIDPPLP